MSIKNIEISMLLQEETRNAERGVSLIEVSIVLVVIGLLAASILGGKALIERARVHKTVVLIQKCQMALRLFYERYGELPGDCGQATQLFGTDVRDAASTGTLEGNPCAAWSKPNLFWQHLSASQLPGVLAFARSGGFDPQNGLWAPQTPFGGALVVQEAQDGMLAGLYFVICQPGGGVLKALLTPAQAQAIDKQMDTGVPTSGSVVAQDGPGQRGACIHNGRYNLKTTYPACVLYIKADVT